MLRQWLMAGLLMVCTGWLIGAEYVQKELPYYEADGVKQGDETYLAERCKLDLYYPEGVSGFPTVIWFHGGGLVEGEKFIPELLKKSGIAVVAPNYRLSGVRATTRESLADAAAATAWVFKHIAEYGGDPNQVYISGGSGGGYLAAMIGMNPDYLRSYGLSHRQFAGIMPVSGQMTTHMQVLNEERGTVGLEQPMRQAIDPFAPLYYVSADLSPITLYVGDPAIEWPARVEENAMLAAMLKRVANHSDVELVSLSGFDHGDVYDPAYLLMKKKIKAIQRKKALAILKPPAVRFSEKPVTAPLVGRMGEAYQPASSVTLQASPDALVIRMECEENAPESLVLGSGGKVGVFQGDSIEIFIAPDAANPRCVAQWGINRAGEVNFVGHGISDAIKDDVTVAVKADGSKWSAELTIPRKSLTDRVGANFFRHHKTPNVDDYANWSPTVVELNYTPEAFGSLTFE